ncbi:MAG: hypothetical protein HUU50_03950 [Candidatus Brocadiae bacterium]|nr:hypothetical protein [Candidatus Brocadiia bacterium]
MSTLEAMKEANRYLFEEAIHAHLDGQAAKVRHLAALALKEEASDIKISIEFNELAWAFVLLIYWLLKEYDYSNVLRPAWWAFGRKQRGQESDSLFDGPIAQKQEEYWITLVNFLMDVIGLQTENFEKDIELLLEGIPEEFFSQNLDQLQLELLSLTLNFTLECVYTISPNLSNKETEPRETEPKWCLLYHKWNSSLSREKKLQNIHSSFEKTFRRLQIQGLFLIGEQKFLTIVPSKNIEKFWQAFYKQNTEEMGQLRDELVREAQKDEEKFYSIQGLLNIQRFVNINSGKQFEDQFYGVYRIQRLMMEHPQWIFPKLREIEFYDTLEKIRGQLEKEQSINETDQNYLLRLTILMKIEALRNWDLAIYLTSLKMQSRASLFWVHWPTPVNNVESELSKGICCAVKSLSLDKKESQYYQEVEKAVSWLEILPKGKEAIYDIVETLLESVQPIETDSAIQIFSMLTDSIPTQLLNRVLKFTVESCKHQTIPLYWLDDIIRWYGLKEEDWKLIFELVTPMFDLVQRYFHDSKNVSMMKQALMKSPIEIAKIWGKSIIGVVDEDCLGILYNAAIGCVDRTELKDFALQLVDNLEKHYGTKAETEYNRSLLQNLGIKKGPIDKQNLYRTEFLSKLLKYSEEISQRTAESTRYSSNLFFYDKSCCIDWSSLYPQEWEQISLKIGQAIKNSFIYDYEFSDLLMAWTVILRQQNQERINNSAFLLLEYLELKNQLSLESEIKNPSDSAKIFAVTNLLPGISLDVAKKIMSWLEEQIPCTEDMHLPLMWKAMLKIYIRTNTHEICLAALNAIKAIYARIATNTKILTKGMMCFYSVLNKQHKQSKDGIFLLAEKKPDIILQILDKSLDFLYKSPNADGRRQCALILSLFKKVGWINEQRKIWLESLEKDVRARVSNVFLKDA